MAPDARTYGAGQHWSRRVRDSAASRAGHLNIGTGEDRTIRDLVEMIRSIVYPDVQMVFDTGTPDGTLFKRLDVSRLHQLGWHHSISLRNGLETTDEWFVGHYESARGIRQSMSGAHVSARS